MFFRDLRSAGALLLLGLGLASCGGGSSASSEAAGKPATTTASGTAPTTASSPSAGSTPASSGASSHGRPATARSAPVRPLRSSSTASSAQFKQALGSFAACLSRNGVKLPSAAGSGAAQGLSLKGVDTKSPSYRKALAACTPVLSAALKAATKARPGSASSFAGGSAGAPGPSSHSATPPRLPRGAVPASVNAGYKRFTACMRSNGVPGFPEPQGAGFNLTGTSVNRSSPQYKTAQTRCTSILMAVDSGM